MKLAIVSGGSRGLGAALCAHYRALGWSVLEMSRSGSGQGHVHADLGQPLEAASQIERALGRIPAERLEEVVAFNNAARLGPLGPAESTVAPEALDNIAVNLGGGIVFMTAILRTFSAVACPKTLVNISSGAASRAIHGWSLYCAAKAGLERYLECVALEQDAQPHPFRVLNISPGVIDTGMQAELRAAGPGAFRDHARFVALAHEGALRTPEDTARRVAGIVAARPPSGGRHEVGPA